MVEELVEQLQQADIRIWRNSLVEQGKLHWLWVAVTTKTAVFHIGSRRKEELSHLVLDAFIGWLGAMVMGSIALIPSDRDVWHI